MKTGLLIALIAIPLVGVISVVIYLENSNTKQQENLEISSENEQENLEDATTQQEKDIMGASGNTSTVPAYGTTPFGPGSSVATDIFGCVKAIGPLVAMAF